MTLFKPKSVIAIIAILAVTIIPGYFSPVRATSQPLDAPLKPSASCPQPDRSRAISSLTIKERIAQGYLPPDQNGKTDSDLDKIIHDRGVHFCADTDVIPAHPVSYNEFNDRAWSGNYADGGYNYTYVQAYWTVSCIPWYDTADAYAAWVGIGGNGSSTLVQTGTSIVDDSYNHIYNAWIQNTSYSQGGGNVFRVYCGDRIVAAVGSGNCTYITDTTSGHTNTTGWRCNGPVADSSQAECIVEAPTDVDTGLVHKLSNYGTLTFNTCNVEVNAGSQQAMGNVHHDYNNMYDGGTLLSSTGPIYGGNNYTMTWHQYY